MLKMAAPEERIYRHRCVEGWSIVCALGGLLAERIDQARRSCQGEFVEFTTLMNLRQMPGQRSSVLEWPYVEGCGWTRPCTRWRSLLWHVEKCYPIRTAPAAPSDTVNTDSKSIKAIVRVHFNR